MAALLPLVEWLRPYIGACVGELCKGLCGNTLPLNLVQIRGFIGSEWIFRVIELFLRGLKLGNFYIGIQYELMDPTSLLERQCFLHNFQYIQSMMSLIDTFIRPTVLYGSQVWGSCFLESDWALAERVRTLFLQRIIKCKQTVPQPIIHSFRVWCPAPSTWDWIQPCLTSASPLEVCGLSEGTRQISILGLLLIGVHCSS